MVDELKILLGEDYVLPCGIKIHHPQIGEIRDYGEERYYQFVQSFCAVPTDYRVALYDAGIDCDEMSDYELFLMLYKDFKPEQTCILFGDLDFTKLKLATKNTDKSICVVDVETGIIFDEMNYLLATQFVRKLNRMKRPEMKGGNAAVKAFLIEEERLAMQTRKKKPFESILYPQISSMVNSPGFKYNYEECMKLPLAAFNESVFRIQKIMDHNALMTGISTGSIDAKKISKERLNWMSRT